MGKIKYFFFLVVLLLFISGCSKKSTPAPVQIKVHLGMELNGQLKQTSSVSAEFSKSSNVLQLSGSFGIPVVTLTINDVATGSFDLGSGEATYASDGKLSDAYISTSGTIMITSFTGNTVAGTFAFNGSSAASGIEAVVTGGTFTATYISGP